MDHHLLRRHDRHHRHERFGRLVPGHHRRRGGGRLLVGLQEPRRHRCLPDRPGGQPHSGRCRGAPRTHQPRDRNVGNLGRRRSDVGGYRRRSLGRRREEPLQGCPLRERHAGHRADGRHRCQPSGHPAAELLIRHGGSAGVLLRRDRRRRLHHDGRREYPNQQARRLEGSLQGG